MQSPLIVALDFPTLDQAIACAQLLDPKVVRVKVGKQLFTSEGPCCPLCTSSFGVRRVLGSQISRYSQHRCRRD
jgi:orotidine-5'-phosphate decarboxylase